MSDVISHFGWDRPVQSLNQEQENITHHHYNKNNITDNKNPRCATDCRRITLFAISLRIGLVTAFIAQCRFDFHAYPPVDVFTNQIKNALII